MSSRRSRRRPRRARSSTSSPSAPAPRSRRRRQGAARRGRRRRRHDGPRHRQRFLDAGLPVTLVDRRHRCCRRVPASTRPTGGRRPSRAAHRGGAGRLAKLAVASDGRCRATLPPRRPRDLNASGRLRAARRRMPDRGPRVEHVDAFNRRDRGCRADPAAVGTHFFSPANVRSSSRTCAVRGRATPKPSRRRCPSASGSGRRPVLAGDAASQAIGNRMLEPYGRECLALLRHRDVGVADACGRCGTLAWPWASSRCPTSREMTSATPSGRRWASRTRRARSRGGVFGGRRDALVEPAGRAEGGQGLVFAASSRCRRPTRPSTPDPRSRTGPAQRRRRGDPRPAAPGAVNAAQAQRKASLAPRTSTSCGPRAAASAAQGGLRSGPRSGDCAVRRRWELPPRSATSRIYVPRSCWRRWPRRTRRSRTGRSTFSK